MELAFTLDVAAGVVAGLIVDSTLLSVLHPRQAAQSAGFSGAALALGRLLCL